MEFLLLACLDDDDDDDASICNLEERKIISQEMKELLELAKNEKVNSRRGILMVIVIGENVLRIRFIVGPVFVFPVIICGKESDNEKQKKNKNKNKKKKWLKEDGEEGNDT